MDFSRAKTGRVDAVPILSAASPDARNPPFHVLAKPIGPICNLDCRYCFYLEKEDLYRVERRERPSWAMPDDLLEIYIRQYIDGQETPEIAFAWQGGEPTLLGVGFFETVVALQKRHAGGKKITNALQTNGTLLDDSWGEFLARENFLIGLSVDGPADLHDLFRVDKQGRPSFDRVMAGLNLLKKHGVAFNTLTVVNRENSRRPLDVYRFLREFGSGFLQFIPLVERAPLAPIETRGGLIQLSLATPPRLGGDVRLGGDAREPRSPVTDWSVRSDDWGKFLCAIFDEWVRNDIGRVFVQSFDTALGQWMGLGSSLCVFSETCGDALAIEHNGDLYSCDHYVYPEYLLGNIREKSLAQMVSSETQRAFGAAKRETLPKYCRECSVRFACNGECPKHRFLRTPDGEWGLNYLCAGYKRYFTHIDPYLRSMAQLLRAGRAPAELSDFLRARETPAKPAPQTNIGRNDSCPCGSGRKYKHCCLARRA